ncbi:hypothetical protein PT974_08066 [Cladobotryum mycophilum]|uniref:NACHT domain-containing protein n=1 Tax=Cladobotryum mycophilum TaxID=491253 RepID=A0ABR0SDD7_9HYPO
MGRIRDTLHVIKTKLHRKLSSSSIASSNPPPAEPPITEDLLPQSAPLPSETLPEISVPEDPAPQSTPLPSETLPEVPDLSQPPLELWDRAFEQASSETQKWIQGLGLTPSDRVQPKEQVEEIIHLIENKRLSEQNDKPLTIKFGNQKIILREYVTDAVNFLTMIGDAAMLFAPPQASMPWALTKAILKIPVKESEQMGALVGTVKIFVRIVRRGQLYELLYNANSTDEVILSNFHNALLDLYVAAIDLLAQSETLFSERLAKQTFHAMVKPDGARDLVSGIFKKEQKLALEVQSCEASRSARASDQQKEGAEALKNQLHQLTSPINRIDNGVSKLLKAIDKAEREKLLDFISSEMFGKGHSTISESRTENTGQWLLQNQDFKAWLEIPTSSTLLWLKGTVGTGKTYLTNRVVSHIEEILEGSRHDEGFAFFYCNRSGPSMQDPLVILKSFVRQLSSTAHDSKNMRATLIEQCERAKEKGTDLSYKHCEELILESLNSYSKTTLVLDALDESDITSHNLAASLIKMLEKSTKPVKIFISSRPDREFLEVFETWSTIVVDASSQKYDIDKFLDDSLYSETFFTKRTDAIQKLIKDTFRERNGGMFRWVYLQTQALKKLKIDEAIENWSRTLPIGLMESYDRLWEDIKAYDPNDVALAERAIKWVMCAIIPLKTDVLLEAIQYALEDVIVVKKGEQTRQDILSLCQDLLTIDSEKDVWMFPHASVAEYFSRMWTLEECDVFASRVLLNIIMNNFFGSPDTSSAQYQEWVQMVEEFRYGSDFYSHDFKETLFYSGLLPSNIALFSICQFGFYYTLLDWWVEGKVTEATAMAWGEDDFHNPLSLAVAANCMPICRHLMGLIDVNDPLTGRRHAQALFRAIDERNDEMMEFLLIEHKVNVLATAKEQNEDNEVNSIEYSIYPSEDGSFEWLLSFINVEDTHHKNEDHGSILIYCANTWGVLEVEAILKAGANVNALAECGCYGSALVAAIQHSNYEFDDGVVEFLLENGAGVNLSLQAGEYGSALEAAVNDDDRKSLELLLEAGADATTIYPHGDHGSALAAAAYWGEYYFLKQLIDHVGGERAIHVLRQSRHPSTAPEELSYYRRGRSNTVKFLAEEVGVDEEIFQTIGMWDVF